MGEPAALLDWLIGLGRHSDPLAAVAVGGFLAGAVLRADPIRRRGPERPRPATVGRVATVAAWIAFGVFWAVLVPHFWLVQKSAIEGIGAVLAAGLSVSAAVAAVRDRPSLFVLSRAVGLMGLLYLPFVAVDPLAGWLVAVVTRQTELLLGVVPTAEFAVVSGASIGELPVDNTFVFYPDPDHRVTYTVRLACTGLGSMAMFAGAVLAVGAPLGRTLRALAVSVPVIWVLNVVRNAFIAATFGGQRLHVAPDVVLGLFGASDPYLVSYFLADRLLAQTGAVAALAVVALLVVRQLPELLGLLEETLYLLTRRDPDLRGALADPGNGAGVGIGVGVGSGVDLNSDPDPDSEPDRRHGPGD